VAGEFLEQAEVEPPAGDRRAGQHFARSGAHLVQPALHGQLHTARQRSVLNDVRLH
jgi:hypothetical protein